MPTKHYFPGLLPGLLLVAVGGGLLAREFGFLPPNVRLVDLWPLLVVLIGVSSLLHAGGFLGVLFSLLLVATGAVMLAGNLGFLSFPAARLWPALLVLVGVAFLIRGGRGPRFRGPPPEAPASGGQDSPEGSSARQHHQHTQSTSADRLSRQFTLSGAQLRIESQAWQGGELGVTGGGVELDLRHARLHPDGAVLDLRIVMGGVEIRVPDTWQVQCEVTPLLGGAEDSTRSTQGSTSAPRLRVIGSVTCGGVEIRN